MNKNRRVSLDYLPGRAQGFRSKLQCSSLSTRPHRSCLSDKCLVSGLRKAIGQLYSPDDTVHSCSDYFYDILCTATGLDREFHKLENLLSCSKLQNDSKYDQKGLQYSINDMMYLNLATKYLLSLMNNLKQEFMYQVSVDEGQDCNSISHTNNIINSLENKLYNLLGKLENFKLNMSNTSSCYDRDRFDLINRPNPKKTFSCSRQERDILGDGSFENGIKNGRESHCCCDPYVRGSICKNRPCRTPKHVVSENFISRTRPKDSCSNSYPRQQYNNKACSRDFQKHKGYPFLKNEFSNKTPVPLVSKEKHRRFHADQRKHGNNALQAHKDEFGENDVDCPSNSYRYITNGFPKVKGERIASEDSDDQYSIIQSKERNIHKKPNNIGNLTARSDLLLEDRYRNKKRRRFRAGKDSRQDRSRTYTPTSRRKKEERYRKKKRRSNNHNSQKRGISVKKSNSSRRRNKHKSTSSKKSDPTTENTYDQGNMLQTYSSDSSAVRGNPRGNKSTSSYDNVQLRKKRSTTSDQGKRNSHRKTKVKSRYRDYSKNPRRILSGFKVSSSRSYSPKYRNNNRSKRRKRSQSLERVLLHNPITVDVRATDHDKRNRKNSTKNRYIGTRHYKNDYPSHMERVVEDYSKPFKDLKNSNTNWCRRPIPNEQTSFSPPEPCVPSYCIYPQCYQRIPFPCENACPEICDQSQMCPAEIECESEVEVIPICPPDYYEYPTVFGIRTKHKKRKTKHKRTTMKSIESVEPSESESFHKVSKSKGRRRFIARKSKPRYPTYRHKSTYRKKRRSLSNLSIITNQRSLSSEEETRNRKRSFYKHIYYKKRPQPGVHTKYSRFGKFLKKSSERVLEYNEPDHTEEYRPPPKDTFSRGTSTEVLSSLPKRTSTSDLIKLIKAIGTNTEQTLTRTQGIDPMPQKVNTPPIVHELITTFTNTERINMRTIGTDSMPKKPKPAIANMATDPLYYLGQKTKDTNTIPEKKKDIKDTGTDPKPIQKVQQTTTASDPLYYLGQRVKHTNTIPVVTVNAGTEALPKPVYDTKGTDTLRIRTRDQKTSCETVRTTDRGNDPIYKKMVDKEQQFATEVRKPKMESVYTGTDPYSVSGKVTQTSFIEVQEKRPSVLEKEVQTERKPRPLRPQVPEKPPILRPDKESVHDIPVNEPQPKPEQPVTPSELSMHLVFEKCHEEMYRKRGDICEQKCCTESNNAQNFIICERKRSNTIRITNRSDCEAAENEREEKSKPTIDMELYFKAKQSPKSFNTRIGKNATAVDSTKNLSTSRSRKTKLSEECGMNVYTTQTSKQTHVSRKDVYDKSMDTRVKSSIEIGTKEESDTIVCTFDWRDIADTIKDDQLSFI